MSRRPAIARGARTNVALMVLLAVAFLTGWLAFASATAPAQWSLQVHAVGGFAILALLPWKSMIARRGMDRPRPGRWASVLLGILVLISLVAGSFTPGQMPVSSWMFDAIPQIEPGSWHLTAGGRQWTYDELFAFDDHLTATLDCTGGFYSTQAWSGVRLDRLVGKADGVSIRVISDTGYDRRFPIESSRSLLLATRFGDQALDAGHGFPARLVVPGGRGFWWVKWVSAIEVDDLPHWWQSPFPLQ